MPHRRTYSLTLMHEVPDWLHTGMQEEGYDLVPASWANALYEHTGRGLLAPSHTVDVFFYGEDGQEARLLGTRFGEVYHNAFADDPGSLTDALTKIQSAIRENA